jgi:hypothetical protein
MAALVVSPFLHIVFQALSVANFIALVIATNIPVTRADKQLEENI